jgi:hypothetical protein
MSETTRNAAVAGHNDPLVMLPLEWTHNKPTEPGFYFRRMKAVFHAKDQETHFVLITEETHDADTWLGLYRWDLNEWDYFDSLGVVSDNFEWAGPIPEPVATLVQCTRQNEGY